MSSSVRGGPLGHLGSWWRGGVKSGRLRLLGLFVLLSALAAGVPVNIIIESVLWPERQIKEGYLATTVVTKDGGVHSGLVHSEDKKALRILDLASGKITTVQPGAILRRARGGTVMPPGLTSSLTRAELRDLIKYLSTLKTGGQPK